MAKAKAKTVFFCKECGYETPKWMGQCPGCHQWNTMTEEKINPVSRGAGKRENNLPHQQLTGLFEVSMEEEDRSSSGIPGSWWWNCKRFPYFSWRRSRYWKVNITITNLS